MVNLDQEYHHDEQEKRYDDRKDVVDDDSIKKAALPSQPHCLGFILIKILMQGIKM